MSDNKEKITVTLENEEIEALYKILSDYFWDLDLDPEKEKEFRKLEWLYNDLQEAIERIDPDRFKMPDWDDFTERPRRIPAGGLFFFSEFGHRQHGKFQVLYGLLKHQLPLGGIVCEETCRIAF